MVKEIIYPHELIGKTIKIVDSTNMSNLNLVGDVVDETKNTLVISVGDKKKTLLKGSITFKIESSGEVISGKSIIKRPEDRMKGK